jgi:hypothetical protein
VKAGIAAGCIKSKTVSKGAVAKVNVKLTNNDLPDGAQFGAVK